MKLKTTLFIVTICMLFSSGKVLAGSQAVPGCEDIERISTLLKTELWPKWEELNRKKIRELWFGNLAEEDDCTTNLGSKVKCVSLSSRGRFTTWCECCYTFNFDLVRLKNGSYQDRLRSLIFFHTETTLQAAIQAAKGLLSAIRASEDGNDPDVADWDIDAKNRIIRAVRWQTPVDQKAFIAKAVEFQIYQTQSRWTLYITISKERVLL